jgi:hypothetical protein
LNFSSGTVSGVWHAAAAGIPIDAGESRGMVLFRRTQAVSLALSIPVVLAAPALAGNGTRLPPSNFVGVRPAAMGQAFTAVADDQNALYYNPAGLARLPQWSLELLSPILGWNSNITDNYSDIKDITGGGSSSQKDAVEKIGPVIETISGENNYVRAGIAPYFVMPQFGMAAYAQVEAEIVPHGQAVPTIIDFDFSGDTDMRMGYAHNFLGQKLSVGASVAYKERVQVLLEEFSLFDLTEISKSQSKQDELIKKHLRAGWGIGVDTGVLFTPVATWSPTLGVSILNIGDVTFRKGGPLSGVVDEKAKGGSGVPSSIPQSVNMGVSVTPTFGNWITRASFDYRDINLPLPASQKPALGVEGGWRGKYVSALAQGGLAEGYLSGGFEVRLLLLNIRYATYKTERGYFPTQRPERRHVVQLKILL